MGGRHHRLAGIARQKCCFEKRQYPGEKRNDDCICNRDRHKCQHNSSRREGNHSGSHCYCFHQIESSHTDSTGKSAAWTSAAFFPVIRSTLLRLAAPLTSETCARGVRSNSATNSINASFARPSVGGVADGYLHCPGVKSSNIIPACSRVDANGQGTSVCDILNEARQIIDHSPVPTVRFPKIAVPIRTQVLPSSIATAKSFDIPIDNWVTCG